ncbi:DUF1989 domain-containing protein [Rhodococcus sp. NPDC057529]|uniref:DUF1989 domain-containing protein n=1 Tax=Rhodococcus sp. NPDC057529 TaxID=3346158 RepID=UPI0036712784
MTTYQDDQPVGYTVKLAPASSEAFPLAAGQTLSVILDDGPQVLDMLVFGTERHGERFSASHTRMRHGTRLTTGHQLISNSPHERALLTITLDTLHERDYDSDRSLHGHDILYPPCSRPYRSRRYGLDSNGCFENLTAAIVAYGFSERDVHDPFNLFMRTGIDAHGALGFAPSAAVTGDRITFLAEEPCLVAVSTCPSASSGDPRSVSVHTGLQTPPKGSTS